MTLYLSFDQVVEINAEMIKLFGGMHGLRDHGALEAAVARPQLGYYLDVLEEATALLESYCKTIPSWTATSARP